MLGSVLGRFLEGPNTSLTPHCLATHSTHAVVAEGHGGNCDVQLTVVMRSQVHFGSRSS